MCKSRQYATQHALDRFVAAVLLLAVLASWNVPASNAADRAAAPATLRASRATVPESVAHALSSGNAQDLIVQFEDTDIQQDAERLRLVSGREYDTPQITRQKSERFSDRKDAVLAGMHARDFDVLLDYDQLPMMFIRFRSPDALDDMLRQPGVVALHEDEIVHATQSTPWNLQIINQPQVAAAGMTGAGTTVAVIDTGVDYTNAAFGACTAPGTPFGCKVVTYQQFCCNDGQLDGNGHGTNVAGIVAGVAPGSRIAALKVLDASGSGTTSNAVAAVNWAITNRATYNIVAMNLSLGVQNQNNTSPCGGSSYASPFANARSAGIVPVVASGNDGFTNGISSPACTPGAVSVGATTYGDQVAYFSNSASFLTLLAPGVSICAAGICMSGTSQATPHVAGASAVLRAAFPLESVAETTDRMTIYGQPVLDSRNGLIKPRLDLFAATQPLPLPVRFAPQIIYSVGSGPGRIVTGDFNGDGMPDLAVSNYGANTVAIFASHDGGLLPPVTTAVAQPRGLVGGDFNRDGNLDLAVISGNQVAGLLGVGNGTFPGQSAAAIGSNPQSVSALDLDGDNIPDLVASNFGSNTLGILLGNPNGTFQQQITYATGSNPYVIATGDFNRDGHADLAVTNYGSANISILLGTGTGTFSAAVNVPVGTNPIGIAAADLDDDANVDLVVANYGSASVSVLRGVGDGTFAVAETYPVGTNPAYVAIADLNADGYDDIIVTNYGSNSLGILLGNRVHTFQAQRTYPTITQPWDIVARDLNGNGKPDIAVRSYSNQVAVLLNIGELGNDAIFVSGFDAAP